MMRHLKPIEMVVIRGALRTKLEHLETFALLEPDPAARATHRQHRDAVKRLLVTFEAGNRILIPFESDTPKVPRQSRR